MIHSSFPKIFALGQPYIKNIFNDEVEITEKIDGSQFAFGLINGELHMRSKGAIIYPESADKMFKIAIEYVRSIENLLVPFHNNIFYCEYLKSPRHNILKYERVPKNNLALFGVLDNEAGEFVSSYDNLSKIADMLDIDMVPLIHKGKIDIQEHLDDFLNKESFLGGAKVEGFVVKSYEPCIIGNGKQILPVTCGKYVSEAFKEVHAKSWKGEYTHKGKWDLFKDSYRTEARWLKSIQYLKEKGELEFAPRDIGKLINAIRQDIEEEEKNIILEKLWKEFGSQLLSNATAGFPEFYKRYLLESS